MLYMAAHDAPALGHHHLRDEEQGVLDALYKVLRSRDVIRLHSYTASAINQTDISRSAKYVDQHASHGLDTQAEPKQ